MAHKRFPASVLGKTHHVEIGADIEYFVLDDLNKLVHPNKHMGFLKQQVSGNFEADGLTLEIQPSQTCCREGLISRIQSSMYALDETLRVHRHCKLSTRSIIPIDPQTLKAKDLEMGCDPDSNIYGNKCNQSVETPFRSAGGHIHLGPLKITTTATCIPFLHLLNAGKARQLKECFTDPYNIPYYVVGINNARYIIDGKLYTKSQELPENCNIYIILQSIDKKYDAKLDDAILTNYAKLKPYLHEIQNMLLDMRGKSYNGNRYCEILEILWGMFPQEIIEGIMRNPSARPAIMINHKEIPRINKGNMEHKILFGEDLARLWVRITDIFVGIPSVLLDDEASQRQRRILYGKAGTYRMQPHGYEYRTLSNFWSFHDAVAYFILGQARCAWNVAVHTMTDQKFANKYTNYFLDKFPEHEVIEAIDNANIPLAAKLFQRLITFMPQAFNSAIPLTSIGIPPKLLIFKAIDQEEILNNVIPSKNKHGYHILINNLEAKFSESPLKGAGSTSNILRQLGLTTLFHGPGQEFNLNTFKINKRYVNKRFNLLAKGAINEYHKINSFKKYLDGLPNTKG
jgi:hypothetical protein